MSLVLMLRRGLTIASMTPCALALAAGNSPATPARTTTPERVLEEVTVAATPLGGLELPLDSIPGNIQRATSADIEREHQASLAQFLSGTLGSVFINEAQSNPLQPDVQFRGFVASPLLGQPQGIAVYQDGVRINDPFGDVVTWALLPEGAIASVDLMPGSNPVFGLNALGGALSVRTKNGFTDPGTQAEAMGGSFGRVIASIESGGDVGDRVSYYGSARHFSEDGWREHSPSDALHLFGRTGWRNSTSSLDLSLTRVETDLTGNGAAPIQLLDADRDAIYTHPDRTKNSLTMVSLAADHEFTGAVQLQGVAYLRRSDIDSVNGDESDFAACEFDSTRLCDGEDEPAFDTAGDPIAFSPAVAGATLNRSSTRQETVGASLQLGIATSLAGRDNRAIVGGSLDRSSVRFDSSSELGYLDDSRGAVASGIFAGDALVDLHTSVENLGVFLTDTFFVSPRMALTLSARYNDTHVELRDQLGTDLNGDHDFEHFNGAAGITYRAAPSLRLYANYSESNRAPSPVELTCADEDDPCALPNAFLADPPLRQVIARTMETGADGTWRDQRWHLGLFRTDNENDILFISAGALTNRGFFDNVGDTRRQGIELNLNGKALGGRLNWFANYTRLQARFRESFSAPSPHNPAAKDGEIAVVKGSRIPGVPERMLVTGMTTRIAAAVTFGLDMKYQSNQFLRGDEGNLNAPLGGYTTFNANAEWELNPKLRLFVQIENLLNRRHATFGLYGAADEVLGDEADDPRFVSPAAPLSAWIGLRWTP